MVARLGESRVSRYQTVCTVKWCLQHLGGCGWAPVQKMSLLSACLQYSWCVWAAAFSYPQRLYWSTSRPHKSMARPQGEAAVIFNLHAKRQTGSASDIASWRSDRARAGTASTSPRITRTRRSGRRVRRTMRRTESTITNSRRDADGSRRREKGVSAYISMPAILAAARTWR